MASAFILDQPLPTEVLRAGVELVPIPAAHLARDPEGWIFEAVNRAYRLTGLGTLPERSPMMRALADRLDAFMAGDALTHEFDWALGEAIDCRHYRVGFARISAAARRRCTVTFLDRTHQLNTERSLRREMTTDSLTGLPNREGFGDLFEARDAATGGHAVLVVDLDRFGRLNACLGSLAGDELLITVARRIKGALRARDALARIGGDEFGVLVAVDDDAAREAEMVAARIDRALAAPFRLTDYEISVECSIGIAADAIEEPEELIRHAQFAAKRAKASGRTEIYQPQAFSAARAQFAIETELRRAIEERQLRLTFQPICELGTGRVVSFEALTRWRDSNGTERSPDAFIPVAEESGLIVPLGRWAIDEAARTLAAWDARAGGACGVRLAVNLSAIQLQRDSVAPVLDAALTAHGLSGDRFTLELTESAIVADPDGTVAAAMHALRELGPTLALDDFGTGYSNLAYLHRLPIDVLKIDKSFVTGMMADRDKVAITRAILGLAQALGKQTTAEGVETNALAQMLAALGCTYGQGWHYGRPLEADDAWARIAAATAASPSSSTRG